MSSPGVEVTATHFAGSTLSGALAQPIDAAAAGQAWGVNVGVVAVRALPTDSGWQPIGPRARLVLSDGSGDLIRPSSRIIYSTRYREVDAGSISSADTDSIDLGTHAGGVAPGSTFAVELSRPTLPADAVGRHRVSLQVFRTPNVDGYDIALVSEDRVAPPEPVPTSETPRRKKPPVAAGPMQEVRETIVVRRTFKGDADRVMLSVPTASPAGAAFAGLVIDLSIRTKPQANDPGIKRMEPEIAAAAAEVTKQAKKLPVGPRDMLIATALDVLNAAGTDSRAPLVYLAQQSGANLTESVSLVADDRVVSLISQVIRERSPQLPVRDAASVAWLLDRATIQTVASIQDQESTDVPPMGAVRGVLASYAGEAGRQLDLLQSLANESAGSADLQQRLVAEHLIYLEDNAPAVRVRAFDWLTVRGLAPAGFDPLADAKVRRAALARASDAAAATTAPTTAPARAQP